MIMGATTISDDTSEGSIYSFSEIGSDESEGAMFEIAEPMKPPIPLPLKKQGRKAWNEWRAGSAAQDPIESICSPHKNGMLQYVEPPNATTRFQGGNSLNSALHVTEQLISREQTDESPKPVQTTNEFPISPPSSSSSSSSSLSLSLTRRSSSQDVVQHAEIVQVRHQKAVLAIRDLFERIQQEIRADYKRDNPYHSQQIVTKGQIPDRQEAVPSKKVDLSDRAEFRKRIMELRVQAHTSLYRTEFRRRVKDLKDKIREAESMHSQSRSERPMQITKSQSERRLPKPSESSASPFERAWSEHGLESPRSSRYSEFMDMRKRGGHAGGSEFDIIFAKLGSDHDLASEITDDSDWSESTFHLE